MSARISAPALGVLADEEHLRVPELARFAQDLGRHDDLADVVQQRRGAQRRDLPVVPAQLGGDRAGERADPSLVTGGVRVSQLGGGAQGHDRRLERAFEPRRRAGQVVFGPLAVADVANDAQQQRLAVDGADAPGTHLDREHRAVPATVHRLEEDAAGCGCGHLLTRPRLAGRRCAAANVSSSRSSSRV